MLEDYYECLHHKKEVGCLQHPLTFSDPPEYPTEPVADQIARIVGYESTHITTSIPKSGGSKPARRCTEGGRNKEPGAAGQG
jgi:hypothetical protein